MRIILTAAAKTLPQLINEFINRKKADGLRDRTLRDYYRELSKFAATTPSLDENDLRHAVVNYFAAIPDTSAAIYNKPYSCLKSFFNWCVDNEYLTFNPIVKEKLKKRGDDSDINAASIDDVKRLLKACNRSSFTGLRNYTMILLMVDTGIRTSEITRLTPNDYAEPIQLNLEKKNDTIQKKINKVRSPKAAISPDVQKAIDKVHELQRSNQRLRFYKRTPRHQNHAEELTGLIGDAAWDKYEAMADAFIKKEIDMVDVVGFISTKGNLIKFQHSTGLFAIFSDKGTISTLFIPQKEKCGMEPEEYWLDQIRKFTR